MPALVLHKAMEPEILLMIAAAIFLFAGTIKGLIGVGLPTAVIGLLSQFTDPRHAIALLIVPLLISNSFQAYKNGMVTKAFKSFWPIMLTMVIGILIFSQFAADISADGIKIIVGLMIIVFVLTNVFAKPLAIPEKFDIPTQIFFGICAGVMGGLTSLWAPWLVMYLMTKQLPKDEFVGALGLLLLSAAVPLLIGYWQAGLTNPSLLGASVLMAIPTLLGVFIGEKGRNYLSAEQFRKLLLFIFFLLGLNLIRGVLF